jgi:hypothetical protein
MMKTMQLVLAMTMAAASMARAQQAEIQPAGGGDSTVAAQFVEVAQDTGNQAKDSLFGDTSKFAKGASDVSEINLDPKTMGLVRSSYASGLAHKMKFMVIHSYIYDKPGMYNMDDVEVYRRKLNDGTWSCSIHVRNKDGATDICTRTAPGNGSEMVIISAEPKQLSFIHMSGNVSLSDMARSGGAAKEMNLDLNHASEGATKTAKASAEADAQARAMDAKAKAMDEKSAAEADARARAAEVKASAASKKKRTFRMGSLSYSSESSTPAKKSSASPSDTNTSALPDPSASSASNTAAPPATPSTANMPAK